MYKRIIIRYEFSRKIYENISEINCHIKSCMTDIIAVEMIHALSLIIQ